MAGTGGIVPGSEASSYEDTSLGCVDDAAARSGGGSGAGERGHPDRAGVGRTAPRVEPPGPGYVWEPARWVNQNGRWVQQPGYWRQEAPPPPATGVPGPAYPAPGYPAEPAVVYAEVPPPAPIVEVRPAPPYGGAVWIAGYWNWHRRPSPLGARSLGAGPRGVRLGAAALGATGQSLGLPHGRLAAERRLRSPGLLRPARSRPGPVIADRDRDRDRDHDRGRGRDHDRHNRRHH